MKSIIENISSFAYVRFLFYNKCFIKRSILLFKFLFASALFSQSLLNADFSGMGYGNVLNANYTYHYFEDSTCDIQCGTKQLKKTCEGKP